MTIKEALKNYPRSDEAELFLAHLLKCSKEDLFLEPKRELTKVQIAKLRRMMSDFKKGKPAAYLLGYKYFYGLKFKVNNSVLIPRPESEWLVDESLKFIKANGPTKVLEIGVGSGCISIALAKVSYGKNVKFSASDISIKPLKVAKENSRTHRTSIKFIQSDLFNKISGKFDLIIANLPYVPQKDYKKLFQKLKYEPKLALVDSKADFYLYDKFFESLAKHLNKDGLVLLELDPKTKVHLESWLVDEQRGSNFVLQFFKDIRGLDRYAKICYSS